MTDKEQVERAITKEFNKEELPASLLSRLLALCYPNGEKRLAILSEDQSLPKDPTHSLRNFTNSQERHAFETGYFACGQDMIADKWRKTI